MERSYHVHEPDVHLADYCSRSIVVAAELKGEWRVNILKTLGKSISAIFLCNLVVPSLAAQSAPLIEEIVVTAQRRAENVQEVPISVTALSADFLSKNDIRSLEDLNGIIPGFVATNSVNYAAAPLSIRGIGGANGGGNFFNDEPVAVYVDDVYISRLSFSTADLIDMQSVQVLRGPQGTLYGRNSTAGAVLLSTARPTEEFEGYIKGSIAEHGEKRVAAALSGSLSDSLQARLALAYSDRDGWGNNTFDGSNVASAEDRTARLSLRYVLSETFTADLILELQDRGPVVPATIAVASVAPRLASTPFVRRPDLDEQLDNNNFALNDRNENESDTSSATLLLNWDLGSVILDLVTSIRSYELTGFQDSDGTQFTLFNNNGVIDSDQWSQEVRLSSNTDSPVSWVTGAFYLQEDAGLDFTINNFQGLFGAGTSARFDARQDLKSWAVFGDLNWGITDQFSVILGARYSSEDKDFNNTQRVTTIGASIPLPIPFGPFPAGARIPGGLLFAAPPTFTSDDEFTDFSPRVVLNYYFNDNMLGYASFSQAYKSGGFNSFGLLPSFDSEEVDAFEVGVKTDLADDRVRLNAAAFVYDYTNLQVRLPVPTGGVTIQNAGAADVKGFELELTWAVSEDFLVSANVTWLDAELTEFITQEVPENLLFPIGAPIPLNLTNAQGNDLTRAPDFQFFASADYSFNLGSNLEGIFTVSYRHQDEVFFLETNQTRDTFASDGSDELAVGLSVGPHGGKWNMRIFGENVTDERTITQVTALGAYPNAAISEPRKWGLEFLYRL